MTKFRFTPTPLQGMVIVDGPRFEDERGHFMEVYSAEAFAEFGLDFSFVQDNQSLSRLAGTLRGLHFQRPPYAQAKLVRVVRGRIWDVGVDIRRSSPTFGQWFGMELSSRDNTQLLISEGFAHGFLTLEPDSEVAYKVSAPYSAQHDAGLAWDDPTLAIDWPLTGGGVTLSDKDRSQPVLENSNLFD